MGRVNPFDKNITKAIQYAEELAFKNGTVDIDTALVYDGIQKLFVVDKELATLSNSIKAINNKYGIHSNHLRQAWKDVCLMKIEKDGVEVYPDPLPMNTESVPADDLKNCLDVLSLNAQKEKAVQTIEDLLGQMFANKSYRLFEVFTKVSENMKVAYEKAVENGVDESELPPTSFDVNLYYADMQKLLAKCSVKEIKSLETDEMSKYLTNINKYVSTRNDLKFVGMENEIIGLEVALAGRTKKSAVLVGPPGTGKTSLIYELARRINEDESIPDMLRGVVIYEMHMDALVAGELNARVCSNAY